MVAQPLRRAEELVSFWLCVAPLRLGGLRGKKSTPSAWLGVTGELIDVGKQELEQLGKRSGRKHPSQASTRTIRQRYGLVLIE